MIKHYCKNCGSESITETWEYGFYCLDCKCPVYVDELYIELQEN